MKEQAMYQRKTITVHRFVRLLLSDYYCSSIARGRLVIDVY